ncbi:MAG: hypothetical protein MR210_06225 [Erysipelotrichaceae bacterium]|nr:hypothetical protein [Erysipelotrichaceae bacterium]MDY5252082.1 hypothetical protein [Erysipelotrichaceae bacterium]
MKIDIDLVLNAIALIFLIIVVTMIAWEKYAHRRKMEQEEAKSNAKIRQS